MTAPRRNGEVMFYKLAPYQVQCWSLGCPNPAADEGRQMYCTPCSVTLARLARLEVSEIRRQVARKMQRRWRRVRRLAVAGLALLVLTAYFWAGR